MKHFSLLQNIALGCCAVALSFTMSSCSGPMSPSTAAKQLRSSASVAVFSHNDASSPRNRDVVEAGPLPDRAARALDNWLRRSTVKEFSYAYPQYYIAVTGKNGKQSVWGICSDGEGNMTGVLIPRDGRPAWMAPHTSALTMYVYDGDDRAALGGAVMEALADAGYDSTRIAARRSYGLVDEDYLLSKPRSAEAQREYENRLRELAKRQKLEKETAAPADDEDDTEDTDTSTEDTDSEDSSDDLDDLF